MFWVTFCMKNYIITVGLFYAGIFFLSIVQCTYAVLFSFPIVKVSINLCLLFAELSHRSDC